MTAPGETFGTRRPGSTLFFPPLTSLWAHSEKLALRRVHHPRVNGGSTRPGTLSSQPTTGQPP
jgi:hypothetical protein